MIEPQRRVTRLAWRDGAAARGDRAVAEETAIALTYNRTSYAVMMATPADLADFAIGFSLTERIVDHASGIETLEIVEVQQGIELRMWVAADAMDRVGARQRNLAGPTGCGLCGLESLADATRAPPVVGGGPEIDAGQLVRAMARLGAMQPLNEATRAVHAAAFWSPQRGMVAVREDVGRHNALDKLAGALAAGGTDPASGALLMTSRISVELVQKAASIGATILAAISAPTALAIRVAEAAGVTLAGIARADGFEVFTHGRRIALEPAHAR